VLALDTGVFDGRREESAREEAYEEVRPPGGSGLVWDLPDTYVLRSSDRVVLAATRRGLAELLGRRGRRERAGA
jgi:hypothetical protein